VDEAFRHYMDVVGSAVDALGVLVIVGGIVLATVRVAASWLRHREAPFATYRQDIGRSILLGLEFLVAGDIIRTVVVAPTLENLIALGVIVLIRTFLSMSLQVELEGRWPWQQARAEAEASDHPDARHEEPVPRPGP